MKIICMDNFARETIADRVVAENVKPGVEADAMLRGLIDTCWPNGPNWYKLVEDDYKLCRGVEDLV